MLRGMAVSPRRITTAGQGPEQWPATDVARFCRPVRRQRRRVPAASIDSNPGVVILAEIAVTYVRKRII